MGVTWGRMGGGTCLQVVVDGVDEGAKEQRACDDEEVEAPQQASHGGHMGGSHGGHVPMTMKKLKHHSRPIVWMLISVYER
eukprot:2127721-Prymnesium_polylepis.1